MKEKPSIKPFRFLLLLFALALPFQPGAADTSQAPIDTSSLPSIPFSGQIGVDARLSSRQVAVGDSLVWTITISWQGSNEDFMFWPPRRPETNGISFSHMQTINQKQSTPEGFESNTVFKLHFVGEVPGDGDIEGTEIKYLSRGAKEEDKLHIAGESLKILPPPRDYRPLAVKAGIIIGLLVLLGLGYCWVLRMRKSRASVEQIQTPLDQCLEQISSARAHRNAGDITGYYQALFVALRQFLIDKSLIPEGLTGFDATMEALAKMNLPETGKDAIQSIMRTCEEMRFSGITPETHETELFESKVRDTIKEIGQRR